MDLVEMAAEQRHVGFPCDEGVSELQLQDLSLTTENGTIVCNVSTTSNRLFVPPSLRLKVPSSLHNLSQPGSPATDKLISDRFVWPGMHKDLKAWTLQTFDVISLFTSIPPALAIDTIDGFLWEKYDETDQQLKRAHIIELLELCLKTFFTFNGQVYEQKKGTPMGSPLSGLIAEAVLQRLEQQVFSSYPPKFWARYVDDTFVVIKRSEVKAFKTLLNSIFPDIQFTMEEEVFEQIQRTPMGSPIAGYLAEAVLRELENRVFQSYMPKVWMRYMDDSFVILPRDMKERFKMELNSIFPQIKFTMKEENDEEIPFLDV
nr:unnamed protein product [Spirometra erinaceieuropaei]